MTSAGRIGSIEKGRRIDRYEIRELVGQGGMGEVYRAIDTKLARTVALKTVVSYRAGIHLTPEVRQRFMREALAVSKVEHRNVVRVLDFGVAADGTPYLVMEYLRGEDLGTLLKRSTEALPVPYVVDVVLGVCAALRACHQVGIIHRDLKPGNIFLADTDTGFDVKVLDFGVSKVQVLSDLTQEGQILGTPQFLSPEQVNGTVGPQSDQYALGVLLYVCLTQRLPFEIHQSLSLLRAIEVGRFEPPRTFRPDLSEELDAIVLKAMSVDPTERFESVYALGKRLWPFASPLGRDQWENYFRAPPAPIFANVSTIASLAGKRVTMDLGHAGVLPTETLHEPASAMSGNPLQGQGLVSTKLHKHNSPGIAGLSRSLSGPSTGGDVFAEVATGRSGRSRRRLSGFAIAGVAVLAGTTIFVTRAKELWHPTRTNGALPIQARESPTTGATPPSAAPAPGAPLIPPTKTGNAIPARSPQRPDAQRALASKKVERPPARVAPIPEQGSRKATRGEEDHDRRPSASTGDWGVDAVGNPIPPM